MGAVLTTTETMGSTRATFEEAVRAAWAILELPAVATSDWPDEAAEALGTIPGAGRTAVLLELDEGGGANQVEAAGSWSAPGAGPRTPLNTLVRAYELAETSTGPMGDFVVDDGANANAWGRALWSPEIVGRTSVLRGRVGDGHRRLTAVVASLSDVSVGDALRGVAGAVMDRAALAFGHGAAGTSPWLTEREREVLDLLVLGQSVRQIADTLGRSPHTVHDHVKNLHRKLGASTRGELVARALGKTPDRVGGVGPSQVELKPGSAVRIG